MNTNDAGRPNHRAAGIAVRIATSGLRLPASGLLILLALTTACFRFTPSAVTALSPGTIVRLHLTEDGSTAMAVDIGPRMESVDGTLVEFAGDTAVVMKMQQSESRGGAVTEWNGETVRIPRRGIASAERKERSPQRTMLVTAGSVVAVVAIAAGFNLFGSLNGGRGQPAPNPK